MNWIAEDIYRFKLPGSPAITPDGEVVVASVAVAKKRSDTVVQKLWRFSDSSRSRPLLDTLHRRDSSETSPCFSPDGHQLAFVSRRRKVTSLMVTTVDGLAPRTLWVSEDDDLRHFVWSNNDELAVVSQQRPRSTTEPELITWLRYKHEGASAGIEEPNALWGVPLVGEPKMLCNDLDRVTGLCAEDANVYLAVESCHSDEVAPSVKIFQYARALGGLQLRTSFPSPIDCMVASGGQLFFSATGDQPGKPTPSRLWRLGLDNVISQVFEGFHGSFGFGVIGEVHPPGAALDLRAVGEELVFVAAVNGDNALFVGDPVSGLTYRLTPPEHSVVDFGVSGRGIVAAIETPRYPSELFLISKETHEGGYQPLRSISKLNRALVADRHFTDRQKVTLRTRDGLEITGFVYESDPGVRAPLIVRVHGGPHLSWGSSFDLESQIYASAGFRVFHPNLRGSAGYGEAFWEASAGEWGEANFDDLMAFTELVSPNPDAALYITGGSYGGFLTNWTIAHTDRFRAAVSERSISNFVSKFGTSDNGYVTNHFEMKGLDIFGEDADILWQRSPLCWVSKVATPVLLIHGEKDQRCPIEQSEQWFLALRRLGREAVLARFPNEGHSLPKGGTPRHRVKRLELMLDWWMKHP
ncbi:MAG: S9 family peptidase [Ferrimicrobium sp.]